VLVQNLAPGAAARPGAVAQVLRPAHRRLIVCDISGYGADGPYRDKKAYDLLVQAEAGLLSVDRNAGAGDPRRHLGGGHRRRHVMLQRHPGGADPARPHRRGQAPSTCRLLESLGEWMGNPIYYAYDGQPQAPRSGASHPSVYPTARWPPATARRCCSACRTSASG